MKYTKQNSRINPKRAKTPKSPGRAKYCLNRLVRIPLSIVITFFVFFTVSPAALADIFIIKSGEQKIYQKVVDEFVGSWKKICADSVLRQCRSPIKTLALQTGEDIPKISPLDVIVTIGSRAADYAMDLEIDSKIIHALIPRDTYQKLHSGKGSPDHSAIFLDQPIERQLHLAQMINPGKKRIGILLGPVSESLKPNLEEIAARLEIELHIETVKDSDQVGPKLRDIFKRSDTLLSIPDPVVFNRKTIRSVLLSSYHSRIPVIGFSKAYVKAGALAAVHSTPEDIGRNIAHFMRDLLENNNKPASVYPSFFSVTVNGDVARSLGLHIKSSEELTKSLVREQ